MHSPPRDYTLIKVHQHDGPTLFLVVATDLADPDCWALINRCDSAREGWAYISEVQRINEALAVG